MQLQTAVAVALICLALVACRQTGWAQETENLLPEKIASMYTGWISPNEEGRDLQRAIVTRMLDRLAENGFNTFYAKFQPSGGRQFDLTDPEQFARVKLIADACAERNLALVAYTYHFPHRMRNTGRYPEHAELEPLVMPSGAVVEDRFALAEDDTLRHITGAVFELARASLELPIASVGFDIEHFMGHPASYNDSAWADFARERGLDPDLSATERGAFAAAQGLAREYERWYFERWDAVVARWCEAVHEINPDLSIAIMPGQHTHRMTRPFAVHAGTERAPAIIDNWGMYNGSGLTEELLRQQEEVRALNPHNRFILWFRPDSYRPEDIRVHAYHTLRETDGYCNWHIGMMLPGGDAPAETHETAGARWAAFAEANETAWADLAAGREEPSIAFVPVEPMVAEMDVAALAADPIPQLRPVGDGSGEDRWIPTRELQQFLIHAEGGERISVALRHLAGQARPLSLQYALITPSGEVLRNEAVPPGEENDFSVDAPESGTYALWITGGAGGQAWYAVNVRGAHFAFPFRGDGDHARFFYSRAIGPLDLYLTRSDPEATARLRVTTGRTQAIRVAIAGGEAVDVMGEPSNFDLPASDEPILIHLVDPVPVPDGFYVQHVRLEAEGAVHPYLSISPWRRLLPE